MQKDDHIKANDVKKWLNDHILRYAMRDAVGGVKAYLEYEVGYGKWVVRAASNLIYYGDDIEQAVKLFNENSY